MSKHRMQVEVVVDDDALQRHLDEAEGARPPYSKPGLWNFDDLVTAVGLEVVDGGDCDLVYLGEISD
jgi:hypothetical protein